MGFVLDFIICFEFLLEVEGHGVVWGFCMLLCVAFGVGFLCCLNLHSGYQFSKDIPT